MSMFAPAEYPTAAEIEKAIREARRERSLAFAQLLGLGLSAVKDAVTPDATGGPAFASVTQGTAARQPRS
jgi:hypothetical protein